MKRVILLILSILSLSVITNAQEGEKSLKLWQRFHLDLGLGYNENDIEQLSNGNMRRHNWFSFHSSLGFRAKYFNIECSFDRPAMKMLPPRKLWRQLSVSGSLNIIPPFNHWKEGDLFCGPTIMYGKTSGFHTTSADGTLTFPSEILGLGVLFAFEIKNNHRICLRYDRVVFDEITTDDPVGITVQFAHITHSISVSFSLSSAIFKKKQKKKEQP